MKYSNWFNQLFHIRVIIVSILKLRFIYPLEIAYKKTCDESRCIVNAKHGKHCNQIKLAEKKKLLIDNIQTNVTNKNGP